MEEPGIDLGSNVHYEQTIYLIEQVQVWLFSLRDVVTVTNL